MSGYRTGLGPHIFLEDCFILALLSSTLKKSPFLWRLRDALAPMSLRSSLQ